MSYEKMCVIQGTSGSKKSTLLNCIGGLDTIAYRINGKMTDKELKSSVLDFTHFSSL